MHWMLSGSRKARLFSPARLRGVAFTSGHGGTGYLLTYYACICKNSMHEEECGT
jgi:hypothetical protein